MSDLRAAASSRASPPPVERPTFDADWWQRGVVYQVYPRSFADSDDDGVGDLRGIVERLDHLNDRTERSLGIDAIWLSPIHPSPGFDVGYDVADYDAIDPVFGTLDDFDRLIAEAHRRGVRVLLDLVMNHTSSAHRWFEASRSDPSGVFGDWYIWRDGVRDRLGRLRPPNNWVSFFGGPAWTWDERRRQFYLHTFLPQQPDLNWRCPDVRAEMLAMVRRWLDRGVDGFRLDVFTAFFKHADLPSNPRRLLGRRAYSRQRHVFDTDQPELLEFFAEFRALVDSYPATMTVGEPFSRDPVFLGRLRAPRHLVFDFDLLHAPWDAARFAAAIGRQQSSVGRDGWTTIVLSNHDQPRLASRLTRRGDAATSDAVAKAAAAILLTLRGTPFLYYGEEIGARDVAIPWPEIVDPPARHGSRLGRRIAPWWNRDQARSPMPWGGGPNGGFSGGRPWLRMAADADVRNVAVQDADPDSVLAAYRQLLALRRRHPALQLGSYRRLASVRDVLAYERATNEERLLVAVDFAARPLSVRPPAGSSWRVVFDTHRRPDRLVPGGAELTLEPRQALVLLAVEAEDGDAAG